MAIITISRGSFSGGMQLAKCLAQRLNYRCVDRDVLAQRTSIRSVAPEEILAALDTPPANTLSTLNHRKYVYLALIQAAIVEEVSGGNAVYQGLAGHLLLQGGLSILRLRVIAPMDFRIKEAQARMNLNREEAIAHIRLVDEHRAKWARYLYGVEWEDPELYDLVINLQYLSVEQACRMVVGMVKGGGFDFPQRTRESMDNFVVATRVREALVKDAMTSNLEVEVIADRGAVTIRGELCEEEEDVERVALKVPGVSAVKFEEAELVNPA